MEAFTVRECGDYELIKEIPYTRSAILHSVIHVKNEDEKEQEEAWELEKIVAYLLLTVKLMELEHIRWLAYMRTEGYRFAKQKNDLGKMHPDLCAMKDLDEGEKGKDLHVRLLMEQQRVLKKREIQMGKEEALGYMIDKRNKRQRIKCFQVK